MPLLRVVRALLEGTWGVIAGGLFRDCGHDLSSLVPRFDLRCSGLYIGVDIGYGLLHDVLLGLYLENLSVS